MIIRRSRKSPWSWPPVRSFTLANLLRLLLGLWVLDAPFINAEFARETIIVWNQIVVGGFVVALAAMRMVFVREAGIFRWAHVALGLWMAASPWILDYVEDEAAFWNSLVSGVLITILAAWSLVR